MSHLIRKAALLSLISIAAFVLAACSSASASNATPPPATATPVVAPTSSPTATPAAASTGETVVGVANSPTYGDILTDKNGMTLYIFKNDQPGQSTCTDACASIWPPLTVPQNTTPQASDSVTGKLGVIQRADGSYQVTINDMPLYLYASDKNPGDTNGQGIKGVWYVVDAAGNPVESPQPTPTGSTP
jgi:predicted lipoprotein with Yx(FWY)xxD motif